MLCAALVVGVMTRPFERPVCMHVVVVIDCTIGVLSPLRDAIKVSEGNLNVYYHTWKSILIKDLWNIGLEVVINRLH